MKKILSIATTCFILASCGAGKQADHLIVDKEKYAGYTTFTVVNLDTKDTLKYISESSRYWSQNLNAGDTINFRPMGWDYVKK